MSGLAIFPIVRKLHWLADQAAYVGGRRNRIEKPSGANDDVP